jgi:hypothetical protein
MVPLSRYYDQYYRSHPDLCDKTDWILSRRGLAADDVFLGSSRAYNMVEVPLYQELTGRRAVNLGTSGSNYAENYLLLRQFVENGNTVRRVWLQADIYSLDADAAFSVPFHAYQFMPWLGDPEVAAVVREQAELPHYLLWRYVPFAKYIEFNSEYNLYKLLRGGFACTEGPFDASLGSELLADAPGPLERKPVRAFGVNPDDLRGLRRLLAWCREAGIAVVLYEAPEYLPFTDQPASRAALEDTLAQAAFAAGLPWLRFREPDLWSQDTLFADATHLNAAGTRRFTRELAARALLLP